jgi:hypothetical protein
MKKIGVGYEASGINIHLYNTMLRFVLIKYKIRFYYYDKDQYHFCYVTNDVGFDEKFFGFYEEIQTK